MYDIRKPVKLETDEPLVIEAGKRYVLRNGRITGRLRRADAGMRKVWQDGGGRVWVLWSENGTYMRDGTVSPWDIIAEYFEAPPAPQEPVKLFYKNWRGEIAERAIIPRSVRYGSTEWHTEPQWLLLALDVEKNAEREFALKNFGTGPAAHELAIGGFAPGHYSCICATCKKEFVGDKRSFSCLPCVLAAPHKVKEENAQLSCERNAILGSVAALAAVISLLKQGGKKAAPSNCMFDQMILDYEAALDKVRAALSKQEKKNAD